MSEISTLLHTLKQILKQRGKTYRDVASELGLSESSVKRIFAAGDLSLRRLEQLCRWLDTSIAALSARAEAQQPLLHQLDREREQQIVDDPQLLLVTVCVMNQWRFEEITQYYQLTAAQCIQSLAQLDRLGLIELQPDNRIKLRVAPNFRWQRNGPIQRFFQNSVANEFFNSHFERDSEQLIVLNGTMTAESNQRFQHCMSKLATEFNDLSQGDLQRPLAVRNGTTAVIAVRQWSPTMFDGYKRRAD